MESATLIRSARHDRARVGRAGKHVAMFKTFFSRAKDALDTASMVATGAIGLLELERDSAVLLGGAEDRAKFFELARSAVSDYGP